MSKDGFDGYDLTCAECGKEFWRLYTTDYAYKLHSKGRNKVYYFCSWTCYRKFQKRNNPNLCERDRWI